jgi:ubiquinone/menaquinone biosynthesis C-methylase UbiE
MSKRLGPPVTSEEFDEAYRAPITVWGDIRIPKELKNLIVTNKPKTSLELGCGLGRFSTYMAEQGVKATGVDFTLVTVERAKKRVANNAQKPTFMVGDVTNLKMLSNQFDVSFDVGCFHCLNKEGQQKYVSEIYRLLKPGATHLIWAMDHSPSDIKLNSTYIAKVFESGFLLTKSKFSGRRIIFVASHWYWLVRAK